MLELFLLGRLQARWRDAPWPLPKRQDALLLWLYLVLSPEERVPRPTVARDLWPEADAALTGGRLRVALHHLQRDLPGADPGPGWLLVDRQSLGWNPAAAQAADAPRFWQLTGHLATSQATRMPADTSARVAELEAAVALYGGDLAPGIDAEWLATLRAAYQNRYRDALDWLAARHAALGDWPAAVAAARRLVEHDPGWEAGQRRLIEALAASGDPTAALRQLSALRAYLADELGTAPEPETEQLASRIRAETAPRPAPADGRAGEAPAPELPPPPARLLGRDAERSALRTALASARLVSVVGPPGSGKSALARATVGDLVGLFPGGLHWLDLADLAGPEALPGRLAPVIAGRLGAEPGSPALLVLDNATPVLEPIATLLPRLLRRMAALRVLVTAQAPLRMQDEQTVALGPLAPAAAAALYRASLPEELAPPDNVTTLCSHLDDLPLAIVLAARGARPDDPLAKAPPPAGAPAWHRSLAASYARSLGLLAPGERRLLAALRRLPGHFGPAAVEALERAEADGAAEPLAELAALVERGLVWRSTSGGASRYRLPGTLARYLAELDGAPPQG
jgi:DNA-binding SARP family transcriptional activator